MVINELMIDPSRAFQRSVRGVVRAVRVLCCVVLCCAVRGGLRAVCAVSGVSCSVRLVLCAVWCVLCCVVCGVWCVSCVVCVVCVACVVCVLSVSCAVCVVCVLYVLCGPPVDFSGAYSLPELWCVSMQMLCDTLCGFVP